MVENVKRTGKGGGGGIRDRDQSKQQSGSNHDAGRLNEWIPLARPLIEFPLFDVSSSLSSTRAIPPPFAAYTRGLPSSFLAVGEDRLEAETSGVERRLSRATPREN